MPSSPPLHYEGSGEEERRKEAMETHKVKGQSEGFCMAPTMALGEDEQISG